VGKQLPERRDFLRMTGMIAGAEMVRSSSPLGVGATLGLGSFGAVSSQSDSSRPDYVLRISASPVEIAPKHIVSTITYNGQFPCPLLRFKEGQPATVEVHNDTDTPEQLHWHGQMVSTDVDGAAEEGTPFIPAHGMRRVVFKPRPSGFDREVFLVLKEFEPSFSQGGDMAQDFLAPSTRVKELESSGESAMKASLAKGMPHGYEVGYRYFTINGRMLGHGEPVRVKQGERVLFHVLNGSATEIRSLALPGHSFKVVALDGNPVPTPTEVAVLWLGTAERISAIAEMNHPGVWIMGDLADDDRGQGMGIVLEYAGHTGKPVWIAPKPFHWDYLRFARRGTTALSPDETFEMIFAKDNAAEEGFNRWTINGAAYPMTQGVVPASFHLKQGRRSRIRIRNASDDIHPIHLHRHSFELTKLAGKASAGVMKDVVMVGGYQEAEVDFMADDPGLTLFHCHQQLHMDFGFMTLFDYV
jgi:FtsP/CotA-like multicopper oxidase with cupredoxin domain